MHKSILFNSISGAALFAWKCQAAFRAEVVD